MGRPRGRPRKIKPEVVQVPSSDTKVPSLGTAEPEVNQLPERKPGGNPAWVKGMPSPNPAGKPKGIPSVAGEIKEGFFQAYIKAGGDVRLVALLTRSEKHFRQFAFKVLPGLFPKQTQFDIEKRVVIFDLGNGIREEFEGKNDPDNVFDAEVIEDEKQGSGEGSQDSK